MSRILVVSDTHGHIAALRQAIQQAGELNYFVHLGDCTSDVHFVEEELFLKKAQIYQVIGNCDYSGAEAYCEFSVHGQRISMVHGHQQRVKSSLLMIGLLAEEKNAEAVLFGHTHIPKVEYSASGKLLFNPGSLGEPRLGGQATYGILTVTSEGIFPRIFTLDTIK